MGNKNAKITTPYYNRYFGPSYQRVVGNTLGEYGNYYVSCGQQPQQCVPQPQQCIPQPQPQQCIPQPQQCIPQPQQCIPQPQQCAPMPLAQCAPQPIYVPQQQQQICAPQAAPAYAAAPYAQPAAYPTYAPQQQYAPACAPAPQQCYPAPQQSAYGLQMQQPLATNGGQRQKVREYVIALPAPANCGPPMGLRPQYQQQPQYLQQQPLQQARQHSVSVPASVIQSSSVQQINYQASNQAMPALASSGTSHVVRHY